MYQPLYVWASDVCTSLYNDYVAYEMDWRTGVSWMISLDEYDIVTKSYSF